MTGTTIGFVGAGNMGGPMARHLLAAGYGVCVVDTSAAAVEALVTHGAEKANSAAEVASRAEIVLLSLPTPEVVHSVAFDADGLVHGSTVRTVIDLSTTGPRASRALAQGLTENGITTIDAPVSGGVAGARNGTLAVMVSGERKQFDAIEPMLRLFGKVFFVGDEPGMAQTMKLINNLISVAAMSVSSEAMVLGAKAGLDPRTMLDVINVSSGRNGATLDKIPNFVLPRSFDFGFSVSLSSKDIALCLEEADAQGVPMIVGNSVRQLLAITRARHGAQADMTMIARIIEEWAGVELEGLKRQDR